MVMVKLEVVSVVGFGEGVSRISILEPVGGSFYIFHKIWAFPLAFQFRRKINFNYVMPYHD